MLCAAHVQVALAYCTKVGGSRSSGEAGDEAGEESPTSERVALLLRPWKFPMLWSLDQVGDEAGGKMPRHEL